MEVLPEVMCVTPVCVPVYPSRMTSIIDTPKKDSDGSKLGGCEFSAEDQTLPEEGQCQYSQPSSLQNTFGCAVTTLLILSSEHLENKTGMAPVFLPL